MNTFDGLKPYLDDLASASPAPGGGAAAAVTLAQGMALLSMVCNLTIGKKRFADVEQRIQEILQQITEMRTKALTEAEADIEAFNGVMAAYKLTAETDEQKAVKKEQIAAATREAAQPPFRMMSLCVEAMPLADELEKIGNPNVVSDVYVGRHLLIAGYHSSKENVVINLNGLANDDPFATDMRAKMAELDAKTGLS